jgi:5-methylcytosine-specific restriction protein A
MVIGARGHLIDFYQSPLWRALRAQVMDEEPICRDCRKEHRATPTQFVDHIIPRTEGGPDVRSNLAGLCARHHSEKTQREMRRSA